MARKRTRNAKPLRAVRGGSRSRRTTQSARSLAVSPMYKSPRAVMPSEFTTTLKYIVQDVVTNVAGTKASIRFRSEAYDVDPAIASTAMPGFVEFAGFYARYRTLALGYKFSVSNQEAFSMSVIHGFSTTSIASGSLNIEYSGNPLFRTQMLGPATGEGQAVLSGKKSIVQISGTNQALFDDIYTGSTASATLASAGTVYCYFGIITPAALTALGCLVTVEVSLDLTFYRPIFLLS
jgi:hypothetical protein